MANIKHILENAQKEPINEEEALCLFQNVQSIDKFLDLAKVASKVRDDGVGSIFKFDGFIGTITPCKINPPCKYCGRSAKNGTDFSGHYLTTEEIELAAEFIAETGVKMTEIGGGTTSNAGEKVIMAVKAVKKVTPNLGIWINVGPSLTRDDLTKLKELGVKEVCSSLETINPDVFAQVKPGDSLSARMKLAGEINDAGLGLASVMMVGLGSSYEDYVEHIFWLNNFDMIKKGHFPITGFRPMPDGGLEKRPVANPIEVAKAGAIARLVIREGDISFGGMMNDPRLLPLWVMAGANRAIHLGPHVHRANKWNGEKISSEITSKTIGNLEFRNMLPLTTRLVKDLGMEVLIK
ncbi:MAG: hypothetical protein A7316_00695 [Candidatus Altiarchaeales archaeon WOR_SM1_86-2]|nr:MAG: hypothetical protein A7315_05385 [Candidatus Altiarchaeales archaeon WOR_SM1_79]ODS39026.1 MAG: hypothetical protein A7316_00695 [Candidatus Altiarchaeales archaeon WOR_SM1_86-2]